jgi:hypothetical protein
MISTTLHLHKMQVSLDSNNLAQYTLKLDNSDDKIILNELIGHKLSIKFLNEINCSACGRKTKKSFSQGYCFPCMRSLAQCDMCIMKPEQCHYDQGTCREPQWGLDHCFKPHYVYLSNTGKVKVGITRAENIPSRWIDQGATEALQIFRVSRRLISGLVEVMFKSHIADKTNWRTMLKGKPETIDLAKVRDELYAEVEPELSTITEKYGLDCLTYLPNEKVYNIDFPVSKYPIKVSSFNLDKNPIAEGILMGIKGQYFIFDTGVINIRKYGGYFCQIESF